LTFGFAVISYRSISKVIFKIKEGLEGDPAPRGLVLSGGGLCGAGRVKIGKETFKMRPKRTGRLSLLSAFALLASILVAPALSQSRRLTLKGKVLDPAGAAIVAAQISAIPDGQASGPSTTSDEAGEFTLSLDSGNYTLKVAADGFRESVQAVNVIGQQFVSITMQVDVLQNVVTVTATDYQTSALTSATKTLSPLRDIPQSISVVTREQIRDQMMTSLGDVFRYVPGVTAHQGENNRDQIVIRGISSSADFFLNGVRDDVQYYRDLYNLDRVEVLRGPNAMIFGRGGGGGVINRVTKEAGPAPLHEITLLGGSFGTKRFSAMRILVAFGTLSGWNATASIPR
jgi:outer membrane receptor protein involved in Fe transport